MPHELPPESQIELAMIVDRHRLRGLWRKVEAARRDGKPLDRWLEQLQRQLAESIAKGERRRTIRPAVSYDPDLPITAKKDEIADAIAKHPVVVVCGETGSGKSTQLPKICLEIGRGIHGLIGHTQPRRIAARSVAARLADELGSAMGNAVGFKIRFTDTTSPNTFIKLMTDGILLAETQGDRFLDQYDTIIVDEAHERSLNIDFLLGYLRRLLPQRPDLRVIITSATIDAERFSEHFSSELGPAPVVQVSGRTYPVDVWYRPPEIDSEDDTPDWQQGVLDGIDELLRHDRFGDILVFLATEREILEVTKALRGRLLGSGQSCEILPLYARLSVKEQNRVFESHSTRRIVLATNVAESSLTVPGIRYVVDSGTARISRYAARSKIQRLPIEPISQASADQRKGRCGRVAPGICVRLFSEDDFLSRDRYTAPEIRRSNLAAVILQAEALQLGAIESFPFIDPPQPHLIRDGLATLFELGAVNADGHLTELGKRLSRLPTDPRIGRMILAAMDEGCLKEILIIAAALEVQDPRERPGDKQQAADEAHAKFADPDSDFLTYLNLWDFYHGLMDKLSRNQLKKACHQNFLSHTRMREWLDVHRQLEQLVPRTNDASGGTPSAKTRNAADRKTAPEPNPNATNSKRRERDLWYGRLHRALLAGLLSNVALKNDQAEYTAAGNMRLNLWPGSGTFARKPKWIVAAELVETTRRYARTVATISPEWIEPLANHLVHRSYSEPHWSEKQGTTMAFEKITLFGLTLVSRRLVPYGPIDAEFSREQFIRHALVAGELRISAPFLDHNRRLREEAELLMAKTRRAELSVDDFAIYGYYAKRLPPDAFDVHRFNRWRRDAERTDPKLLFMSLADMTAADELPSADAFPDQCQIDRMKLPLEYHFEPGAERDGVTLVVPREGLNQISPERLGWLVPGLLEQKIEAMIRALPKNQRRNLVPAPETAQRVVRELRFGEGRFVVEVAKRLSAIAGEPITPELLEPEHLPSCFQMNVRVTDASGKALGEGRDLQQLREQLGVRPTENQIAAVKNEWHKDGIARWDFGPLPDVVELKRGGVTLSGYPALVDQGEAVAIRLCDTRDQAACQSRAGLRRLFFLADQRPLKAHVDYFPSLNQLLLFASGVYTAADFRSDLATLIADLAFVHNRPFPRSADEFEKQLRAGRNEVEGAVQDLVKVIPPLFKNYQASRLALEKDSPLYQYAITDLREQLSALVYKNFLVQTPWPWLQHLPRYLDAQRIRLQKLASGGQAKDRQAQNELAPLLANLAARRAEDQRRGVLNVELETFRWMLEELRVSLFAQQLGTSQPVSVKRLEKQWERVVTAS